MRAQDFDPQEAKRLAFCNDCNQMTGAPCARCAMLLAAVALFASLREALEMIAGSSRPGGTTDQWGATTPPEEDQEVIELGEHCTNCGHTVEAHEAMLSRAGACKGRSPYCECPSYVRCGTFSDHECRHKVAN
jgi:hypothetical protein